MCSRLLAALAVACLPQLFFRVAIYHNHSAEGGVPANRFYYWVDEYVGEHATGDGKSCHFNQ